MIENIKNSVKINKHVVIQISTFISIFLVFFPFRYTNLLVSLFLSIGSIFAIFEVSKSKHSMTKYINPFLILMSLGFIWSLITYFWIVDVQGWQQANLYFYIGLGFSFTISYLIYDKNFLKIFFLLIAFTLFIHNILGWFEVITGNYLFFDNTGSLEWYRTLRLPATFFYNTNDFAFYLFFGIIVLLFLNVTYTNSIIKKYSKYIRRFLIISSSLLIYFTQSRIIQVCLVLTIILLAYFSIKSYKTRKVIGQISIAIGIIVLILVMLNYENIIQVVQSDSSGEVRFNLSASALKLIQSTNFRGVGAGSIAYNLENFDSFRVGGITALHNWWLELFAMYGIVFFIVYIFYYISQLVKAFKESVQELNSEAIFAFVWLLLFIPASFASSTNFDELWIWLVNSLMFVLLTTVKSKIIIKDKVFEL